MIKSTTCGINIDKITVPDNFKRDLPKEAKIMDRYRFYKRTGSFDREILVDEHYNLLDGYTTYLVCRMIGLTKIRVLRIKVSFTTQELLRMAKESLEAEYGKVD